MSAVLSNPVLSKREESMVLFEVDLLEFADLKDLCLL